MYTIKKEREQIEIFMHRKDIITKYDEEFLHLYYFLDNMLENTKTGTTLFDIIENTDNILLNHTGLALKNMRNGFFPTANILELRYETDKLIRSNTLLENQIKHLYAIDELMVTMYSTVVSNDEKIDSIIGVMAKCFVKPEEETTLWTFFGDYIKL